MTPKLTAQLMSEKRQKDPLELEFLAEDKDGAARTIEEGPESLTLCV
jgi:hypothetical protein